MAHENANLSQPHPEYERTLPESIEKPAAMWRQNSFSPADDQLFEGFEAIHDVAGDRRRSVKGKGIVP
jgi:N-acyl homoserine lactone hydrolase